MSALYQRTYSIGWKGSVFEVCMDQATAQEMREITEVVYSAFSEGSLASSPPPVSESSPCSG